MAAEQTTSTNLVRIPQWTVGDRLRKARETSSIGVEEMAGKINRTRNSVSRYERARTVDINVVRSYAALTDTPIEWLLTGFGPENDGGVSAAVTLRQRPGNWSRRFDETVPRPLLKLAA